MGLDRFTKYAHFLGLKHPFTGINAHKCGSFFVNELVTLHGFLSFIVSDRDWIFFLYVLEAVISVAGYQTGL